MSSSSEKTSLLSRLRSAADFGARALDAYFAQRQGRSPRRLTFLIVSLTHRCNCRCRICGLWRTPASDARRELSTEGWLRVLDGAKELGTLAISITGGEPLLRGDLFPILQRAHDLGMKTHVCSNGLLLNKDSVRRLAEAGLSSLSLSMDGPSAERHNLQRGVNCFGRMVEGVRTMRRMAPWIRIGFNYVLNVHNYRLMREAVRLAADLGASGIRFAPIHTNLEQRLRPSTSWAGMQLDEKAMRGLKRELVRLQPVMAREMRHRNSRLFLDLTPTAMRRRTPFDCMAGYLSCCVSPDGIVAPCPDLDSTLSVRENALHDIWRGREFNRMRRRVRACCAQCWDSTYSEVALRFTARSFLRDPLCAVREAAFYLGGGGS